MAIKLLKNTPSEVMSVIKKINQWMEETKEIPYNCDPWMMSVGDPAKKRIIASNFEDGFSCLVFGDGKWWERDYEGFDYPLRVDNPEMVIIEIMSM